MEQGDNSQKNYQTDLAARLQAWAAFTEIYVNEDVQRIAEDPKSARWAFQMIWSMLSAAKTHAQRYETPTTHFKMGPHAETPPDHNDTEMQFQHLDIQVHRIQAGQMEGFVNYTLEELPRNVTFSIRTLLKDRDLPSPITLVDISLEKTRYSKLTQHLAKEDVNMVEEGEVVRICWTHESDTIFIGNDLELHDAIEIQQQSLKWIIKIMVVVMK